MKIFKVITCFVMVTTLFWNLNCYPVKNSKNVKIMASAVKGIIKDYYLRNSVEFDIIAADIENWKFASDVIETIAKCCFIEPVAISFLDRSKLD